MHYINTLNMLKGIIQVLCNKKYCSDTKYAIDFSLKTYVNENQTTYTNRISKLHGGVSSLEVKIFSLLVGAYWNNCAMLQ